MQRLVQLAELAGGRLEHPSDGIDGQLRSAEVWVLLLQVEDHQLAETDHVLGDDLLDRRAEELLLRRCELTDHLFDLHPLLGGEVLQADLARSEAIAPGIGLVSGSGWPSPDLVLS